MNPAEPNIQDPPREIREAAALVANWFRDQGIASWEFMELCSRDHARPITQAYGQYILDAVERVCLKRIEEIEGHVPTADEVREHGNIEVGELSGIALYLWKGSPICEYVPAMVTLDGFKHASVKELTLTNGKVGGLVRP